MHHNRPVLYLLDLQSLHRLRRVNDDRPADLGYTSQIEAAAERLGTDPEIFNAAQMRE